MTTPIGTGTKFHYTHQDGVFEWQVDKPRGQNTWECFITEPGYRDVRRVFGSEEIGAALASQRVWGRIASAHDEWWNSQPLDAIVHYNDGFGQFVRGKIVPKDGENVMLPTGLVGKWSVHDLPRYNYTGAYLESTYVKKIRLGETIKPNYSNMVEAVGMRERDVANGVPDPRHEPEIDLMPPLPTAEQVEAHRLSAIAGQVQALLVTPEREDGTPYSATLLKRLKEARDYLDRHLKDQIRTETV